MTKEKKKKEIEGLLLEWWGTDQMGCDQVLIGLYCS